MWAWVQVAACFFVVFNFLKRVFFFFFNFFKFFWSLSLQCEFNTLIFLLFYPRAYSALICPSVHVFCMIEHACRYDNSKKGITGEKVPIRSTTCIRKDPDYHTCIYTITKAYSFACDSILPLSRKIVNVST